MVETSRLLDFARHPNFRGLMRESSRALFAVDYDFEARLGRPAPVTAKADMDMQVKKSLKQCGVDASQIEYLRNTICLSGTKTAIERVHSAIEEGRLVLELDGRQFKASYGALKRALACHIQSCSLS
jgi:hypothetical protein